MLSCFYISTEGIILVLLLLRLFHLDCYYYYNQKPGPTFTFSENCWLIVRKILEMRASYLLSTVLGNAVVLRSTQEASSVPSLLKTKQHKQQQLYETVSNADSHTDCWKVNDAPLDGVTKSSILSFIVYLLRCDETDISDTTCPCSCFTLMTRSS